MRRKDGLCADAWPHAHQEGNEAWVLAWCDRSAKNVWRAGGDCFQALRGSIDHRNFFQTRGPPEASFSGTRRLAPFLKTALTFSRNSVQKKRARMSTSGACFILSKSPSANSPSLRPICKQ